MGPKGSDCVSQFSLPDRVAVFLSTLLMAVGIGMCACGVAALILDVVSPECKYVALPVGLVTIALQSYIIASESRPHIYNFFAVFIPDVFLMAGFLAIATSLCTFFQVHIYDANKAQRDAQNERGSAAHEKSHIGDDTRVTDIIVLAFCWCGWLLSLIRVVLLGIEITRHRRRCCSSSTNTQRNMEDNLEIPEVVESLVGDDGIPGNVNIRARESVHYNHFHPYHPLRMHPVDSAVTIRSVAPDLMGSQLPFIESQNQHPNHIVETPLIYSPSPSRA